MATIGGQELVASMLATEPGGDSGDPSVLLGGDLVAVAQVVGVVLHRDAVEPANDWWSVTVRIRDVLWASGRTVDDGVAAAYTPPRSGSVHNVYVARTGTDVGQLEVDSDYVFVLADQPPFDTRDEPDMQSRLVLSQRGRPIGVTPTTEALVTDVLAGTPVDEQRANTVRVVAEVSRSGAAGALGQQYDTSGLLREWQVRHGFAPPRQQPSEPLDQLERFMRTPWPDRRFGDIQADLPPGLEQRFGSDLTWHEVVVPAADLRNAGHRRIALLFPDRGVLGPFAVGAHAARASVAGFGPAGGPVQLVGLQERDASAVDGTPIATLSGWRRTGDDPDAVLVTAAQDGGWNIDYVPPAELERRIASHIDRQPTQRPDTSP